FSGPPVPRACTGVAPTQSADAVTAVTEPSAGTAAAATSTRFPKNRRAPYRIPIPRINEITGLIPKAVGTSPTAMATTATRVAYGNWVRTWSTWSHADAMELMTVVSEIGEQWSPKIEPAMIELITPSRIVYPSPLSNPTPAPIATASGTTTGKRIAIVPHDVP